MQQGHPVAFASIEMSSAETRYAMIEKELLAVVFACERFDQYVYGRTVNIESDHKPLETITKKPIANAPRRLQRMLLRLQRYDIRISYKKGSEMWLADTLSRAYLTDVPLTEEEDFEVSVLDDLVIPTKSLDELQANTLNDQTMQILNKLIKEGWPEKSKQTPQEAQAYFNSRDELTVENGLILKGNRIVVPALLRRDMIKKIHRSHIGIEGCLRRARELMYWPNMNGEIKEHISHCEICNTFKPDQQREPLIPHSPSDRPWAKIGMDLFEFDTQHYIIMVDYFSNYWEVKNLEHSTTTRKIVSWCREQFSRHGIPDEVMTDNGPQYSSEEFGEFAKTFGFKHVTSSPRYPQSNGRIEKPARM